ncbi:MAG: hypothetical protein ACXAAO_04860 [Candidatus Thorarchaeota archaeon]|jgi:hypothetical protein
MIYGAIITLAILIPNFIWMARPPVDQPMVHVYISRIDRILQILENLGRIGVFILPLFYEPNLSTVGEWFFFSVMLLMLIIYYSSYAKYFLRGRRYDLLSAPLGPLGMPLVFAPIVYYLSASVVLRSVLLFATTIVFGIAHFVVSWKSMNIKTERLG